MAALHRAVVPRRRQFAEDAKLPQTRAKRAFLCIACKTVREFRDMGISRDRILRRIFA
jgi:hypothetical protein